MIELVIACFIGILIGTTTGMIPGIHVNTAGAILFASSTFLLTFLSPEFLCVLMVAMSIAHALIEFVPSMLLGVPQEGTAGRIWSNYSNHYYASNLCNCTSSNA